MVEAAQVLVLVMELAAKVAQLQASRHSVGEGLKDFLASEVVEVPSQAWRQECQAWRAVQGGYLA